MRDLRSYDDLGRLEVLLREAVEPIIQAAANADAKMAARMGHLAPKTKTWRRSIFEEIDKIEPFCIKIKTRADRDDLNPVLAATVPNEDGIKELVLLRYARSEQQARGFAMRDALAVDGSAEFVSVGI